MTMSSPGARFRAAIRAEQPLQVPGTICAYHAILAEKSGFKAIYLSGAVSPPDRWVSRTSVSRRSTTS
jgi:2-methylisocitrate lyase-like PEP mutase family enzyme